MDGTSWIAFGAVACGLIAFGWVRGRGRRAAGAPAEREQARDEAVTTVTSAPAPSPVQPTKQPSRSDASTIPTLAYEEDEEVDPTKIGSTASVSRLRLQPPTKKIVFDEDAALDEPTRASALIFVSAQAQTDRGLRRKRNEDSILALPDHGLFVVADGMGGYEGGEIASAMAVKVIESAFTSGSFAAEPHDNIPTRASELARAIQMANDAILEEAQKNPALAGMGTTVCAIRFASNKGRLYVGHVGDSRLYRMRNGELHRMTSDHTMKDFGVKGPQAAHLSRAVGIWATVAIDVILGTPLAGDIYILCSDGLTKMVDDDELRRIASTQQQPTELVEELIRTANANGGKDNVSVIAIRVANAV